MTKRTDFWICCKFKRIDDCGGEMAPRPHTRLAVEQLETWWSNGHVMGRLRLRDGSMSRPFRMDQPSFLSRTARNFARFRWGCLQ